MTILALYLGAALTSGFVILAAAWITSSTPWISIADVNDLLKPTSPIEIPASLQYAGLGTFAIAVVVFVVAVADRRLRRLDVAGGRLEERRSARRAGGRQGRGGATTAVLPAPGDHYEAVAGRRSPGPSGSLAASTTCPGTWRRW